MSTAARSVQVQQRVLDGAGRLYLPRALFGGERSAIITLLPDRSLLIIRQEVWPRIRRQIECQADDLVRRIMLGYTQIADIDERLRVTIAFELRTAAKLDRRIEIEAKRGLVAIRAFPAPPEWAAPAFEPPVCV